MAHDVFVSYAAKDKTVADAVCAVLESRNIRCWIAPRDVLPGTPYGEAIIDAIHGCKVMVLVFSSHANVSGHIPKEVERAVSKGVTIIPLRIEDVIPAKSLDYFIASLHWLDAMMPPLEKHLANLADTIDKIVPRRSAGQEAVSTTSVKVEPTAVTAALRKRAPQSAWIYGGAAAALAVAILVGWLVPREDPISLAVLPFHTVEAGEKQEIEHLRTGIPDEIRMELANFRMKLPGMEDAVAYETQGLTDQEIGSRLKVKYVLTGRIHKLAQNFGIDVQLLRISDGVSLLGKHYDITHSELPSLQHDITSRVAIALKIPSGAIDHARVNRRQTENDKAYDLYLNGRTLLVRHTEDGIRNAAEAFEKALQLDPNYALAYAGLAMACAEMPSRFAGRGEVKGWTERAKDAAMRALELNNKLPEAHQALAAVYRKSEYNWDAAITESRLALELDSNLDQPHYYMASAFYHLGLLDKVENEVRAALDVNGEDRVEAQRNRGVAALLGGRYDDAVGLLEEVQRLSAKPQSDLWLARAYYYLGKTDQAKKMLEELSRSSSASSAARSKATLAAFLASSERERSEALLRAVAPGGCERASEAPYMDHHVAHSLGSAYAQLGKPKEAVCWLRRAAETGFPCYAFYAGDPLLKPIRHDPDFQAFLSDQQKAWELAKARYAK